MQAKIYEITTRKLGFAPLHTSTQIQFEWNGTRAIPPYIDCSEREHDNATFLTKMEWDSCHSIV
jgi:hypothetical protein